METELVILEVDKQAVVEKLLSFGAKKIFDADMNQVQYKGDGFILRVRQEGDQVLLNMKKRKKDVQFKVSEEYEVEVADFDQMAEFLSHLPLKYLRNLSKHRESYKIGEVKFEFDKYLGKQEHVPEFLEIEGEDRDELLSWVEKLGFSDDDISSLTTTHIIKRYKKK